MLNFDWPLLNYRHNGVTTFIAAGSDAVKNSHLIFTKTPSYPTVASRREMRPLGVFARYDNNNNCVREIINEFNPL